MGRRIKMRKASTNSPRQSMVDREESVNVRHLIPIYFEVAIWISLDNSRALPTALSIGLSRVLDNRWPSTTNFSVFFVPTAHHLSYGRVEPGQLLSLHHQLSFQIRAPVNQSW